MRVWLFAVAALVALIGLGDALYLTIEHLAGRSVRCTIVAGCDAVLQSEYASIAGFPLAGIGAAAYFAMFSLSTLIAFGQTRLRFFFRLLAFAMLLASVWLFYLQAKVIGAFCFYCLVSAALSCALAALAFVEWFASSRSE